MKLNKKEFLETELGQMLTECICGWEQMLDDMSRHAYGTPDYEEAVKEANLCNEKWNIFRVVLKQFYGKEYHFTRTDDYYGICTEDESDWLFKVDKSSGKETAER